MMIVVGVVGLILGISFPAMTGGLDNIRLSSAADSTVVFLNGALNRAERLQEPVELSISLKENSASIRSNTPGFQRQLAFSDGIRIAAIHPVLPADDGQPRRFMLLPGAAAPRIGIELANKRGSRRIVRVDPITGVPQVER
jgi:hypothetical protein